MNRNPGQGDARGPSTSSRVLPVIVFAAAVAACVEMGCGGPEYVYVPQENATAAIGGRVAADYPIPPTAPTGDVRLASYGVAELAASDGSDRRIYAIHLRMSIADNGSTPFTVDTRDQRLDLEGHGMSAPAFASADAGSAPPIVTVAAGGKREIDLFFPLPTDLEAPDHLPAFDALWRVRTDDQVVAERTPFERIAIETQPVYADEGAWGWGGPYWYDPYFAGWGVVVPPVYWRHGFVHGWRHPHYWHGGWHRGVVHGGHRR